MDGTPPGKATKVIRTKEELAAATVDAFLTGSPDQAQHIVDELGIRVQEALLTEGPRP